MLSRRTPDLPGALLVPLGWGPSWIRHEENTNPQGFVLRQVISGLGFAYAKPVAQQDMAGPGFSRLFISWPVAYINPSPGKSWMSLCCSPQSQNPALSHQSLGAAEEQCSVQGLICPPEGDSQLPSRTFQPQAMMNFWRMFHYPVGLGNPITTS